MNIKLIITSLLALFLLSGCKKEVDPGLGGKCAPKWWKNESSNSSVVYGYGREGSRDAGTATALSLAAAQRDALMQINTVIRTDIDKGVQEVQRQLGDENVEDFRKAISNELLVDANAPCNYCSRNGSSECEDGGKLVVFTRVKINIDDYLNQDLRDKMNDLLAKPEELLDDLKNK